MTVAIKRTKLAKSRAYWIGVLGKGGTLDTRRRRSASCRSVTEARGGLAALPRSWVQRARFKRVRFGLRGRRSCDNGVRRAGERQWFLHLCGFFHGPLDADDGHNAGERQHAGERQRAGSLAAGEHDAAGDRRYAARGRDPHRLERHVV
jgi:hypothetical protein